jgi:hypothetical protein
MELLETCKGIDSAAPKASEASPSLVRISPFRQTRREPEKHRSGDKKIKRTPVCDGCAKHEALGVLNGRHRSVSPIVLTWTC